MNDKMHLHYMGPVIYDGVKYHAWRNCKWPFTLKPQYVITDYDHFNMMTRGSWTLEDLGL